MQTGSVGRHGDGWRGRYREDGRQRVTRIVRTKGEARALLNAELARIEMGDRYRAPITLAELAERFLDQYVAAPQTVKYARVRLKRPLAAIGDAQAGDVTPEAIQRVLAQVSGKAWRHTILRTLRMVYRFGVENHLVDQNPALKVKVAKPIRGEKILPLSIDEVDRVAAECGRWGPLVAFMADSGARPGETIRLEWRHVDLDSATVELPGFKTDLAWRTVHLTSRGVDAIRGVPAPSPLPGCSTSTGGRSAGRTSGAKSGTPPSTSPASHPAPRTTSATATPCTTSKPACRSQTLPDRWATATSPAPSRCTAAGYARWARTPPSCAPHGSKPPRRVTKT
jgi:integrase